jgi:GT2 family glycosyltransferase
MPEMMLSICIVTRDAKDYLRNCLRSITENPPPGDYEIIIVDNASVDGTLDMLRDEFPAVQIIANATDTGYTAPMNQALRQGKGRYLMQLNPDTLVHLGALAALIDFADQHPEIGVVGPKVLNADGSMQKSCRRGDSRPWAAFSYMTGLARLFPHSKFFGGYHLNHLDEDETNPVDGVAGSCMLMRRSVAEQLGFLDERYFAYQEDADYCYRVRQAGYKVYYLPLAHVTHFGGRGGTRVQPYRSIYAWHRSYWLYYHKNFAKDYFFLFNWFYDLLILLKLALALLTNFLRREKYAGPKR